MNDKDQIGLEMKSYSSEILKTTQKIAWCMMPSHWCNGDAALVIISNHQPCSLLYKYMNNNVLMFCTHWCEVCESKKQQNHIDQQQERYLS